MLSKVQFQQFQIIQCTRVVVLYCFGHFSFTLAKNAHILHAAHITLLSGSRFAEPLLISFK